MIIIPNVVKKSWWPEASGKDGLSQLAWADTVNPPGQGGESEQHTWGRRYLGRPGMSSRPETDMHSRSEAIEVAVPATPSAK